MPNEDLKPVVDQFLAVSDELKSLGAQRADLLRAHAIHQDAIAWQDSLAQYAQKALDAVDQARGKLEEVRSADTKSIIIKALQRMSPTTIRLHIHHVRAIRQHADALNALAAAKTATPFLPAPPAQAKSVAALNEAIGELREQKAALLDKIQEPLRAELTAMADRWVALPTGRFNENGYTDSELLAVIVCKAMRDHRGKELITTLEKHVDIDGAGREIQDAIGRYRQNFQKQANPFNP